MPSSVGKSPSCLSSSLKKKSHSPPRSISAWSETQFPFSHNTSRHWIGVVFFFLLYFFFIYKDENLLLLLLLLLLQALSWACFLQLLRFLYSSTPISTEKMRLYTFPPFYPQKKYYVDTHCGWCRWAKYFLEMATILLKKHFIFLVFYWLSLFIGCLHSGLHCWYVYVTINKFVKPLIF